MITARLGTYVRSRRGSERIKRRIDANAISKQVQEERWGSIGSRFCIVMLGLRVMTGKAGARDSETRLRRLNGIPETR